MARQIRDTRNKYATMKRAGCAHVEKLMPLAIWLHENRVALAEENETLEKGGFDYPDYMGMPKKLSRTLSNDMVDLIQDNMDAFESMTPKETMLFLLRA